jgi:putative colanic acid biosynthesis UDP-glucose lipid carrier transferase
MTLNKMSDLKQATKNDPRTTKIGSFLRRTSLDEMPQFFNVLMGDMSVVGPRPHMLKHTKDYADIIDGYMVRQLVLPGITGSAQVNGFRGETKSVEDMENRVKYDVWYLENWTLLLDIKLIFLTIINLIKGSDNAV